MDSEPDRIITKSQFDEIINRRLWGVAGDRDNVLETYTGKRIPEETLDELLSLLNYIEDIDDWTKDTYKRMITRMGSSVDTTDGKQIDPGKTDIGE